MPLSNFCHFKKQALLQMNTVFPQIVVYKDMWLGIQLAKIA